MAKRTWLVRPDIEIQAYSENERGELVASHRIPAVSRDALVNAVLEGVVMVERAGGVLSLISNRDATGIPHERVTTAALVEWKDRVDARPQPERDGDRIEVSEAEPVVRDGVVMHAEEAPVVGHDAQGNEVDESAVPPEFRGAS